MKSELLGKHSKEKGQAFVEFALTITLFLLLVLGIIEVGRLLFYYSAIATAAREGARYGSAAGGLGGSQNYYEDCAGIIGAATRVGQFAGVRAWDVQITYDDGSGNAKGSCGSPTSEIELGDRIIVQVNGDYEPFAGLIPIGGFTITSIERRTIVKDVEVR
jgi:Flp pilus assembly protein TadG